MTIIHHDKETYSEIDIKACGVYVYATHPTTDCLVTSGLVDGENAIRRWRPGDPYPYRDIHPRETRIYAWNASFERLLWQHVMVPRYGWPKLELEQFVCTSAQARMMAAGPAKLEHAGQFYRTPMRKDHAGHLHMLKMCRPATEKQQLDFVKAGGRAEDADRSHHTPAAINRLHDYCDPDVWVEAQIEALLPGWTTLALEAYWASERINDRGMVVDRDFARAAIAYADDEKLFFAREVERLTGGVCTSHTQAARLCVWMRQQLVEYPEALDIMKSYDGGLEKYTLDKDARSNLLAAFQDDPDIMPPELAQLVEVLDAAGKGAVAKYQAILNRAIYGLTDNNVRVHGSYMFAGASQSTRYSSTGIQVHNLPRTVPHNAVQMIKAFKSGVPDRVTAQLGVWGKSAEPVHALGALIRPTITGCPKGEFDLVWCDWSSIEARMLPWLAHHPDAEKLLELYRRGEDVYLHVASDILSLLNGRRTVVTKDMEQERQAYGKVPVLSLGYLGGEGALAQMAKAYGVRMDETTRKSVVRAWRDANPWAMRFGDRVEAAATNALDFPGASFGAGRLGYRYDEDALGGMGALFCILPSGAELCYPGARLEAVETKWGERKLGITAHKSAWRPKKDAADWPRVTLWRGLLIENASQAMATAEMLRLGLARCEALGLKVCAHTHDEIVIESDQPEDDGRVLHMLMTACPPWPGADMLPLHAEWGAGFRYKVKI